MIDPLGPVGGETRIKEWTFRLGWGGRRILWNLGSRSPYVVSTVSRFIYKSPTVEGRLEELSCPLRGFSREFTRLVERTRSQSSSSLHGRTVSPLCYLLIFPVEREDTITFKVSTFHRTSPSRQ